MQAVVDCCSFEPRGTEERDVLGWYAVPIATLGPSQRPVLGIPGGDDQQSAWRQDARQRAEQAAGIFDVLDHVECCHCVEPAGVCDIAEIPTEQGHASPGCALPGRPVDLDPTALIRCRQPGEGTPGEASHLEDA